MFLSEDSSVPWTKTLKQAQHFGTMCFVFHRLFIEQHASKRLNKTSEKNNTLGIQSYSHLMIGVSNHLLSIVFRFHYHSQKVIGSLGIVDLLYLEIRLMGDAVIAGMLSILFEFLTIFVTCYTPED